MKDLTQGSVTKHLLRLSLFLMGSMLFQSLYFLADMYWVGRLGKESVAAVGLAANLMLLILAATQSLGVGTTTLIAHAVGEKDQDRANQVFNQAFMLSIFCGAAFFLLVFLLRGLYCDWLAADATTSNLGRAYLFWFVPALALQFPLIVMGAALRGAGVVKPTVSVLALSVMVNLVLAPVLIFGWGTGYRFGIAGAAMASLVALIFGSVLLFAYFLLREKYLRFQFAGWRPAPELWRRILAIGLPSGAELAILAVYLLLVYLLIRPFGATAQGGFAIGARINQSLVLPAVAVGMANAPIVGQSFGARDWPRVRRAFLSACVLGLGFMALVTVLCQFWPEALVRPFAKQAEVVQVASDYLRVISTVYFATALIFATVSVFQGIGNTKPPFLSSVIRLVVFAAPVSLLARQTTFRLKDVWYLSAASIAFQALANLVFLWWTLRKLKRAPADERSPAITSAISEREMS